MDSALNKRQERAIRAKQTRTNYKLLQSIERDNTLKKLIEENGSLFNIFGSPNGSDLDILVSVNEIISNNKHIDRICELYAEYFTNIYSCDVDINLVVVKDHKIQWVAHGTCWETNNALFTTYALHEQQYPCFVDSCVEPNNQEINMKIHRAVRNILSIYTRSVEYRDLVKKGLHPKSTLTDRLEIIKLIDNTKNTWASNRDDETKIFRQTKRGCYQVLQTLAILNDSVGLYTKDQLLNLYPEMKCFLYRESPTAQDYNNLNLLFQMLIHGVCARIKSELINLNDTEVLNL